MQQEVFFEEHQRFRQPFLLIIMLLINGSIIFGALRQVIGGHQLGNNPMSNTGLLVTVAFLLLVTGLLFTLRLDTRITRAGIDVRFHPIYRAYRHYSWDSISKSYLRQYSPIGDYGGWGLRSGIFGKGKAWNVSGDKGLQLIFRDESKFLIGTNKPAEAAAALAEAGHNDSP